MIRFTFPFLLVGATMPAQQIHDALPRPPQHHNPKDMVLLQQPLMALSKSGVESPYKHRLAPSAQPSKKVAPGMVRWHRNEYEAVVAARTSGKPVLVFQLLGQLDDEFC